ncbi:probable E3 ubiquitin-protein ligase RNF144A-A [Micropterus dolomieu]|uniref:probable E3 ubiquitin-protein ligase RNF144A-A n=1 Tax=Micropterus dolomieu TaxID=147949 RepID=UPI001E8E23D9|nr:probable E3 ubiquitin-protein ligase RNF144A-A [Micropterus dolomieu]
MSCGHAVTPMSLTNWCREVGSGYGEERSSGSQLSRSSTTERKCYDPQDRTFTFVDGVDDLDFLCEDFKSLRAKMSCGHAVTPMSLTNWCRRLLDQGECRFVCGQTDCHVEWPFEEVCKMALLTKEEMEYFEKTLFSNVAQDYLDVKLCPGCKSRVVRADLNNLCVECTMCTPGNKMPYMFCWQCLREWRGPAPRSDRCENNCCISQPLGTLRDCPEIIFNDVKGVTGCPSIRACPTCGFLVEHNKTQCKTIICPRCKVKFCFVCLKFTEECLKLNPYNLCSTGVAPRQTSLPVWHRK